jgi:biotin carboxylase
LPDSRSAKRRGRSKGKEAMAEQKNIFVLGLEDFTAAKLQALHGAEQYRFLPLLEYRDVKKRHHYPVRELLAKASDQLTRFGGPVDAIIGYWDLPVSTMVPILCAERGLRAPSLESVLKCEHKYWSRLEQQKVIAAAVPAFALVDPFDDEAQRRLELAFPFWLKPVKSFASYLGFKVSDAEELDQAIATIREGIREVAEPFNDVLSLADLPPEIAAIEGHYCMAEEIIGGWQCTVCGYVHEGEAQVYGIVDSVRERDSSSFSHYKYPSSLPAEIQTHLANVSKRVMERIGYDSSTFNIEYFCDLETGTVRLLEMNPRLSQSHVDLFEKVDGQSDLKILVDLALGRGPEFPHREGRFKCAGKFFVRRHEDALVRRIPDEADRQRLAKAVPGTLANVHVHEGMRLSELTNQDSYSFEVADLFVGADNEDELVGKFHRAADMLAFDFAS